MAVMAAPEVDMYPLLKVSPPIPVGRLAGRFKLQLWRASSDFQLKLPLAASQRGEVIVMADAAHLGLHEGDEVYSINDVAVQDLNHAADLLEQSGQEVDIHFYHKESELLGEDDLTQTVCCGAPLCSYRSMPVWCDVFYNPPEPRCRAETWQLREVLSTSKVIELPGNMWRLHLQRYSMKQSFALPLGFVTSDVEPSEMSNLASEDGLLPTPKTRVVALPLCESFSSAEAAEEHPLADVVENEHTEITFEGSPKSYGTVVVLNALPLLGLRPGDELCRVNGHDIHSIHSWKAATRNVMKITLDFQRKTVELWASPSKMPDRRRSEDMHSVSSTKDCSRECSHTEDSAWSLMLYKSSCRPNGQNSVETMDTITSRITGTSQAKLTETQDVIFL